MTSSPPTLFGIITVVDRASNLNSSYTHLLRDLGISAVMRSLLLWSAGLVWSMDSCGFISRVSMHGERVEKRMRRFRG